MNRASDTDAHGETRTPTGPRVLYLTINPNLGASTRVLPDWFRVGRELGTEFFMAIPEPGPLSRWLDQVGVAYRYSRLPWPNRWKPWQALRAALRLWWWARRNGCNIIHTEHDSHPFAALLSRISGWPIVCQSHFVFQRPFAAWAFGGKRTPASLLWTTAQQAEDCREATEGIIPADRQHILPLGLSLERFGNRAAIRDEQRRAWGIEPHEIVLGCACAWRPYKRVEDFITVVKHLAREDERVVGLIAGHAIAGMEEYRDLILKLIEESGLGRRLRWVGNLEDVEPFYHAIDVFLSPSEYETFGMSVCEAMACGKPVVAYRGGSVHEVVGETGMVVPNKDVDGLTRETRELVTRADLRAGLGKQARERVATVFDPAQTGRQLVELYSRLIASRAGRA